MQKKLAGLCTVLVEVLRQLKNALDLNFYISFGGPVTFKNAKKPKEVAGEVPLDICLLKQIVRI